MKVFNTIMRNESICPDFHRAEEDQEVNIHIFHFNGVLS